MSHGNPNKPELGTLREDHFEGGGQITSGELADLLNRTYDAIEVVASWPFQTNQTVQYAGGFVEDAGTPDDFSPSVNFGTAAVPKAAHVYFVTGAVPSGTVLVTVTGTSINDSGVRTPGDSEIVAVPSGAPVNSWFETAKKWNGQVTIETTGGTPISMNYGWAKYYDLNNQDYLLTGLEALWESDSGDSSSDIDLCHYKADGWTYQGGGPALLPPPIARRSTDHGAENTHETGPGAWKRAGLDQVVRGSRSEGIFWRITSGNTGVGTLSFRSMSLQASLRKIV